MADFGAPSFSLGLDCGLLDSEPQFSDVSRDSEPSSSNHFSVSPETLKHEDDDFETLIVDDSEPDYPDPRPKLKRLRRGPTVDATSSSIFPNAKVELHSVTVVDDEDRRTDEHLHTSSKFLTNHPGKRKAIVSNAHESISTSCNNPVFPKLTISPLRRFLLIESDSDFDDPSVSDGRNIRKHNQPIDLSTPEKPLEDLRSEQSSLDFDDSVPHAIRYFFHNDAKIQELVRSRLPNFAPLNNTSNRDLDQPSTSNIDYIGQFSCSKQATSRNFSRKLETEDSSQGWVNPKLAFDKKRTKDNAKRKVNSVKKTAGHWVTGSNGKKVYVGKKGEELTGRVAYMQYKKESGVGVKWTNRKYATKKKKK